MPCDSITTQSIKLANALPDLLRSALEAEGFRVTVGTTKEAITAYSGPCNLRWDKGKGLTVYGSSTRRNEAQLDRITKAYSSRAVKYAAKRAGWTVKQTSPERLTVSRR